MGISQSDFLADLVIRIGDSEARNGVWTAAERLTWAFAFVGLPAAQYQLVQIQRSLTRRAKFSVGFNRGPYVQAADSLTGRVEMRVPPLPGMRLWYRVLPIQTLNTGSLTARDVAWNYFFPEGIEVRRVKARDDQLLVEHAPNGTTRVGLMHPLLLTGSHLEHKIAIAVPATCEAFEFKVKVAADDVAASVHTLRVDVYRNLPITTTS